MNLMTPSVGLFFWQFIVFILLTIVLNKYVWNPLIHLINKREKIIVKSLEESRYIKHEMNMLSQKKKYILNETIKKQEQMLELTHRKCVQIEKDAKYQAMLDKDAIIYSAKVEIDNYKREIIEELKHYLLHNSIILTKKILMQHVNIKYHKEYISSIIDEL